VPNSTPEQVQQRASPKTAQLDHLVGAGEQRSSNSKIGQ
jgi:hypothetical protein